VLVVDDNVDSAQSLSMLLRTVGHDTRCAHDGEAAVEAAVTWNPDVVLLDIGMPKMDGYEACRRIRANRPDASLRLVALTGWGQDHDRAQSKAAGFAGHLVKPVSFAELRALIETPRSAPSAAT
jgi:CheY-like chemotaxis protein